MPRSPRLFVADGIYHVTARGNNGDEIFRDDLDRSLYLQLLATAARATSAHILAYVLMVNHLHLAVQTTAPNLYETMHRAHRPYAARFNRRYGRTGHLFGDRYHSKPVIDDPYLLETTRYIHLNPVRAGVAKLPEDHPWSSYRCYVRAQDGDSFVCSSPVLQLLASDPVRAGAAYEEFVLAGLPVSEARRHDANGSGNLT